MSDEKDSEEGLYEKVRRLERAGPHETQTQADYRQRLIARSRKTHLGEGPGVVEKSATEKLRAAAVKNPPPPPPPPAEETDANKKYRENLIAAAKARAT